VRSPTTGDEPAEATPAIKVLLRSRQFPQLQHEFTAVEGYALQRFAGDRTLSAIQQACQREFPHLLPDFVMHLVAKLATLDVLTIQTESSEVNRADAAGSGQPTPPAGPRLKEGVTWIPQPDGNWLLRNPDPLRYARIPADERPLVEALGSASIAALTERHDLDPGVVRPLLQTLAQGGFLAGVPAAKPKRGKFSPMQLLFFRIPLWNPDRFLDHHIDRLRWMWSRWFGVLLAGFLGLSAAIALARAGEMVYWGQQIWQHWGATVLIPFVLLTALVVTLHELGHAFTLKRYGGTVPTIGLLIMCLMPAAYTDSTDAYQLTRSQRVQVVAAGLIVQATLAAVGLWGWLLAEPGGWVNTGSYLLTLAGLFTLALNFNPLAKFDGYYLTVAATGILNLRSRSFGFYQKLLTGQAIRDTWAECCAFAVYAPFSLIYIWMVFGFLFLRLLDWTVMHIPVTVLALLAVWAVYFFWPRSTA
jgi:putative peptide zinc metalloprotease protein